MKPCSKNRKLIAWLALDALDVRQAQTLREHLATAKVVAAIWRKFQT